MTTREKATGEATQLMVDHPGWFVTTGGRARRAFQRGGTIWMITTGSDRTTPEVDVEIVRHGTVAANACPIVDTYDPGTLPLLLRGPLLVTGLGRVHRIRNPDLWDAMLPQFFCHRRRVADGARAYRSFCKRYGTEVTTKSGSALLPPRPDAVIDLDDDAFTQIGFKYQGHATRLLAQGYLRRLPDLTSMPSVELFKALQEIHGIGKWSAARAVADTTGDFSFYPQADFQPAFHWAQIDGEVSATLQTQEALACWEACTHEQRATLTALTIHKLQTVPFKAEAANIDSAHSGHRC